MEEYQLFRFGYAEFDKPDIAPPIACVDMLDSFQMFANMIHEGVVGALGEKRTSFIEESNEEACETIMRHFWRDGWGSREWHFKE